MSHDYHVRCQCGKRTDDAWNHAEKQLIEAVEDCAIVYMLRQTAWGTDLYDMTIDGMFTGLAPWLYSHFTHGGFSVCGEYSGNVPVPCTIKDIVRINYNSLCMDRIRLEIDELQKRLDELRKRCQPN